MPIVKKEERYVEVTYQLCCGFERAEALAGGLEEELKEDDGFWDAKDDTRGWESENQSVVVVGYRTLADANRLDKKVRELLSRKVDYTYDSNYGIGYGSRGGYMTCNPITTITEKTVLTRRCENV
jgi:hypothetical protein